MGVSQKYRTFPDSFESFANTGIQMLLVGLKSIFYPHVAGEHGNLGATLSPVLPSMETERFLP